MKRKLLTIEDLENFYNSKYSKNMKFDANDEGYQLAVQIPMMFEAEQESENETIKIYKTRAFHVGKNRNGSSVTKEAAERVLDKLAYVPLLANFCEYTDKDGNVIRDFTSHDMTIETDNSTGESKIVYQERQIGCFTADKAYFEEDKENGKTYICANIAIPNEYSDSNVIIARKGGTKTSVEILINQMSYNCDDRCLDLEDITVQGMTCLGLSVDKDGNVRMDKDGNPIAVEEGMQGANISLQDFSKQNNSMFSSISEEEHSKLIDTLSKLNATLEKFNINNDSNESVKNYGKEDENLNGNMENEEVVEKVVESEEVVEATEEETAEVTDESATEETVEETPEVVETESEEEAGEAFEETEKETEEIEEDEEDDEPVATEEEACKKKKKCEKMSRTYEISHEDLRYALYELLAPFEGEDYYYIEAVYDDHFCYSGWCTGDIFGQKYTKDGDNVSFDGERYALHRELLTDSEFAALNDMRANYAELAQFKKDTEFAQLHSQREAILADEKYAVLAEKEKDAEGNEKFANEAYEKLVSEMDNYSLTDLEKEVKSIFADYVINKGQFAANVNKVEEKTPVTKKVFASSVKKTPSRYGNLFSK